METIHRDYAPLDVRFYFVYKALAHPELNGYVQPVTLDERLMHVKEARRTLGSTIPWICDGMDNAVKEAFGNRPNSEFIIGPDGTILVARDWSSPDTLRADLERLVGPVEKPTSIDQLGLKTAAAPNEAPTGLVKGVERPGDGRALVTTPIAGEDGEPFYVKLRAEAGRDLLEGGRGQLYLGFHLDPLYHVHWNNLVEPIRVTIAGPDGVTLAQTTLTGPKVDAPADADPREFLVDVGDATQSTRLRITVSYFACNDDAGWCKPVSQAYDVTIKADPHGGRVMSGRAGRRGAGGRPGRRDTGQRPGTQRQPGGRDRVEQMFQRMDRNGDGKISRDEAPAQLRRSFDRMDTNGDGQLTVDEFRASRTGTRGGRS